MKPYLVIKNKKKPTKKSPKSHRPEMRVVRLKDHCTPDYLKRKYPDYEFVPLNYWPTMEEIQEALFDGYCETVVCGCPVEPDGYCEHGYPSWLLALGLI